MTYLRPHNRVAETRRRTWIFIFVIVAAFVGVLQALAPTFFPTFFAAVARPFWRLEFAAQEGMLKSPTELAAENESLKLQLADLRMQYASSTVSMIEADNRALMALWNHASSTPKRFILGTILARPTFLPYDILIIDVGSADGVASTSLIYAAEKVLIGRTLEVLPHTTKVKLFSSPGETYTVSIGDKHVPATAFGRGGGQYEAQVPHGSNIQVGDVVLDGTLSDRSFGIVAAIETDPSDPFDTVMFAPPVNIFEARFVLVR